MARPIEIDLDLELDKLSDNDISLFAISYSNGELNKILSISRLIVMMIKNKQDFFLFFKILNFTTTQLRIII